MMKKPVLYMMLGFPGAGKTTTARIIHDLTDAVHIWADKERQERFDNPTHSHEESLKLYEDLNRRADALLGQGKDVIFDTNFNFYKDRERMRNMAASHGGEAVLIWVRTPKEIARERATHNADEQSTRILGDMPEEAFERLSGNLQPPREDEKTIQVDGTCVTQKYITDLLQL